MLAIPDSQVVRHRSAYRVDGEVGRFEFETYDVRDTDGRIAFHSFGALPIRTGKQWYQEVIRMANKSIFASLTSRLLRANAVNEAGGLAYKLEPKHALAQVAATGTFGNVFYSTAETQLAEVLKMIDEVDDNQYLAKLDLNAREKAFMKDMPAALLVALSVRDTELMHRVFDRVADNGRVLRTVF